MNRKNLIMILVIVLLLVLAVESVMQYAGRKKMERSLKITEQQLDSASKELQAARISLTALKSDLLQLQAFVDSTSRNINALNAGKMISARKFNEQREVLMQKIAEMNLSLDSTREELKNIHVEN